MSSVFNICGGENASYTPPKKGGGETPSEPMKDVNFIDYDGKIVASYTADEFASLSAMPDNPSHEGLVAQGWNWSFEDAQEYVAEYGKLVVGQMYITESEDTEIDITLYDGRLEPVLGIAPNGTVEIDWGDGSAVDTVTGTSLTTNVDTQHIYANEGYYTIKLHVVNGNFGIVGNSSYGSQLLHKASTPSEEWNTYQADINKIRMGANVTVGSYAFYNCYSLSAVSMPNSLTDIGRNAFSNCYSLPFIAVPGETETISQRAWEGCYLLKAVSLPNSLTQIGQNLFSLCTSLRLITIPSTVDSIRDNAFNNAKSLVSITIPRNVTRINASAFYYCKGLKTVILTPTTPPTLSNTNAFGQEASDRIFIVPRGSLEAYQTASNWSTYASAMQEASA